MITLIHVNAPNILPSRHESTETTQLQKLEASKSRAGEDSRCHTLSTGKHQLPTFRREAATSISMLLCSAVYLPYLSDVNWRLRSSGTWLRLMGDRRAGLIFKCRNAQCNSYPWREDYHATSKRRTQMLQWRGATIRQNEAENARLHIFLKIN
jgi:hypothetical protein